MIALAWPVVVLILGLALVAVLAWSTKHNVDEYRGQVDHLTVSLRQDRERLDKLEGLNVPHELERLRAMIGPAAKRVG